MSIIYFSDTASGRRISMNTSQSDCVLIQDISKADLKVAIEECEALRASEYWNKLMQKSKHGEYIVILEGNKTAQGRSDPKYLKTAFLEKIVPEKQSTFIRLKRLQMLTMQEQVELFESNRPSSRKELREVLRVPNEALACDFLSELEQSGTPLQFVEHLNDFIHQEKNLRS